VIFLCAELFRFERVGTSLSFLRRLDLLGVLRLERFFLFRELLFQFYQRITHILNPPK